LFTFGGEYSTQTEKSDTCPSDFLHADLGRKEHLEAIYSGSLNLDMRTSHVNITLISRFEQIAQSILTSFALFLTIERLAASK